MRLIDADKLCEYANNLKDKSVDANDIMRFPRVDAVPVVRCKECKKNPHWEWVGCPMAGKNTRKPDDYCSYGERREDGFNQQERSHP